MKRIIGSAFVAGVIGAALLGAGGTAAASEAPLLPKVFPSGAECMQALEAMEQQEGVRGVYACYPRDGRNPAGVNTLDRQRRGR
ncbi:hypothetical protein [Nocardia sp. NPDC003963]